MQNEPAAMYLKYLHFKINFDYIFIKMCLKYICLIKRMRKYNNFINFVFDIIVTC